MFTPMLIGAIIGTIMILLGFFALLSQKIYLDAQTNSPIEINVPIMGKMKANYPALVFVFLGCVLVVLGLNKYTGVQTNHWQIDGTMISDTPISDWQSGKLQIFPIFDGNVDPINSKTGKFIFTIDIPQGKTVEDEIQRIQYTNAEGNILIIPKDELGLKQSNQQSMLVAETPTSRSYQAHLVPIPGN
jgi:hypothetical protein